MTIEEAAPETSGGVIPSKPDSVSVVTLGCPKNLVDSESMLGQLHQAGFPVADKIEDASLVVVNTCGFLTASQEESIDTILEVSRLKSEGKLKRLVVSGCLSQRHGADVLDEIDEIDYLLGPGTYDAVASVAEGLLYGDLARGAQVDRLDRAEFSWQPRVLSGPQHTAYLKISEGCNNTCTFCIIPQLRGKHRSRPIEDIVAEAERLVQHGVKELTIVAQDTTSYGLDLYKRFSLDRLILALEEIDGLRWIRLLYTYPRYWTDELLSCFSSCSKLIPYVDMPIQHASESVLKRMRRGAGWERTDEVLQQIRAAAPDMALRTTVITGFPGETEAEFEEMMSFLREFEFDNLGAFAYSTESGTPAGEMADQIPEEVREERRKRVMEQQRGLSLHRNRARIGREFEIIVDETSEEKKVAWGRWTGQAPEIDGQVILNVGTAQMPRVGDMIEVNILGAGPYDLVAALPGEAPETEIEV